jgi:hypothetical protein
MQTTHLFNQTTGMLWLLSFFLKATAQYLHVKSYGGNNNRFTTYLSALPVIDDHTSIYKYCANILVFYQYALIVIFFFQYRTVLAEIWKMWEVSP